MLKLTAGREGVGGTELAVLAAKRLVTYLLLFMGTKIPDPGVPVVKYFLPSTSPLFFPLLACSGASSIPANFPGLPATAPRYLTVPCMPPGTLTESPIWTSSRGAIGMSSGPSRPCVGVVVYAGDKRGEGIRGVQVPQGMVVGWVHGVFSGVSKERIRLEGLVVV